MFTENLKCFFVWYVIICHLTTYRASITQSLFRDQLSRLFALLWNIPGRFLIKILLNIVSSLPIVFSLCARVGWCDVCMITYRFYQLNKSRCRCKGDATIEYLTRAIFEKQLTALHVVRINIFLSGMCLFCWQNANRNQNCSFDLIYIQR